MNCHVKLSFGGEQTRVPTGWTWLQHPFSSRDLYDGQIRKAVHSYGGLADAICYPPTEEIIDLYATLATVYIADRWFVRDETVAPDGWTRSLMLSVPVMNPDLWNDSGVNRTLIRLLDFVTSDRWSIEFRPDRQGDWQPVLGCDPVEHVALFSGGLDSFSFAVERLNTADATACLVSHTSPPGLKKFLPALRASLKPHLRPAQFQVQVNRFDREHENELTQRTRGLLFMAAGLLLCSGNRVPRLFTPENGLLSVNPPLTPARPGANMTKSVHPMTLHLLHELLRQIGSPLRIENPYALLTKGEVCRAAVQHGGATLGQLAATVTCSRPETYSDKPFSNCGYCYACLVRHASLHAAGGDFTRYRNAEPGAPSKPDDRLALQDWLSRDFTVRDLLAGSPFPPDADLTELTAVVTRSREELAAVLS